MLLTLNLHQIQIIRISIQSIMHLTLLLTIDLRLSTIDPRPGSPDPWPLTLDWFTSTFDLQYPVHKSSSVFSVQSSALGNPRSRPLGSLREDTVAGSRLQVGKLFKYKVNISGFRLGGRNDGQNKTPNLELWTASQGRGRNYGTLNLELVWKFGGGITVGWVLTWNLEHVTCNCF